MKEDVHAGKEWEQLQGVFHDLCQPLTALLCLLEVGKESSSVEEMRASMGNALHECERLRRATDVMRRMIQPDVLTSTRKTRD